jgi:hypothetical protein
MKNEDLIPGALYSFSENAYVQAVARLQIQVYDPINNQLWEEG